MRIRLFIAALILLFAGQAWGATYYVDATRANDSGDGLTLGNAKKTIGAVLALSLSGSNTILILPGTYGEAITLNNAKYANLTIAGANSSGIETSLIRDNVIISGTGSLNTVLISSASADNLIVRNITLLANRTGSGKSAFYSNASVTSTSFVNVRFTCSTTGTSDVVYLAAGSGHNFDKCLFEQDSTSAAALRVLGGSTATISYSIFRNIGAGMMKYGVRNTTTGAVTAYNNVFSGYSHYAVLSEGAATHTVNNNILFGGTGEVVAPIVNLDGTLNASNNLILSNPFSLSTYITGATTDNNNIKGTIPRITSYGRTGYIIPCVDDSSGITYVQALSSLLSARNMKGTWFINQSDWDAGNNIAAQQLIAGGIIEVGSHSYSHQPANATTLGTITYSGAGANPKYVVDLTNHQFCVQTDTVDGNCQTLSSTNDNSFASILSAIRSATSNQWNITYTTVTSNTLTGNLKMSSLAEVSATAITTPIALNISDYDLSDASSGFYNDEIKSVKTWMEDTLFSGITDPQTALPYKTNSIGNPYNVYSANYAAAERTAGYLASRSTGYATLNNIDMYGIKTLNVAVFIGATEEITKAMVRSIAATAAENGLVLYLLAHNEGEASTTDANGWPAVLDALKEYQDIGAIKVTSAQLMASEVRASPWTYNATTGYSTRTYNTFSDYHLRSGSPAINAGVDVGLTTDYDGKKIVSKPDIGAYERRGKFF